jgi:hypothetical protein
METRGAIGDASRATAASDSRMLRRCWGICKRGEVAKTIGLSRQTIYRIKDNPAAAEAARTRRRPGGKPRSNLTGIPRAISRSMRDYASRARGILMPATTLRDSTGAFRPVPATYPEETRTSESTGFSESWRGIMRPANVAAPHDASSTWDFTKPPRIPVVTLLTAKDNLGGGLVKEVSLIAPRETYRV